MDAKDIVKKMKLEDKISLCTGKDYWQTKDFEQYGIPSVFMCDGPNGLRKQDGGLHKENLGINDSEKATCYPAACTMSNSWNIKLENELGVRIAKEAKNQKVGMVLGPGINIKRNPLCGRNFEYFSEDPVLAGKMGAGFINGIQSEGVSCSLKHFACNSQENNRFTSSGVIDDRTLNEIYLKGFEIAVKQAKPKCVMSSYPKVNGVYSSDNKKLLNDILRDQWGFDGIVVTDWGGMNNRIAAMEAGNDLMMPGGSDYMEKELIKAVKDKKLDEKYIDRCCERIIDFVLCQAKLLEKEHDADYDSNHEFALKAAQDGAVLLKNDNHLLPIQEEEKVLIVGTMAKNIRYQGAGSSHVNATRIDQPIDYFKNYEFVPGCDEFGDTNNELLNEIETKAKEVNTIIVFAGLPNRYESEGYDRDNLYMPQGHIDMINRAHETGKNVVVVLSCGCVVDCSWQDKADAILYMGLGGQAVGQAVCNLLYGKVNPSGKLSETWPLNYEDVPNSPFYNKQVDALYKESIYVGYRYFDSARKEVRYPFGYGLSYSNFIYKDIKLDNNIIKITIENNSDYDGSEIAQLYVSQINSSIFKPIKELKDFTKVFIPSHQEREIQFEIKDDFFTTYDDGWVKCKGKYNILIGSSSRNIHKSFEIDVDGQELTNKEYIKGSWYETLTGNIDDDIWMKMLGYQYKPTTLKKGEFTLENSIMQMKDYSLVMKMMYRIIEKTIAKSYGGKVDYNNPEFRMMVMASAASPLRTTMISGQIRGGLFPGLLEMANGHYIKGIITMIKN
ncbi:MAG: glycoside hydrolase family 3 C-terminal domain-containing protein [Erysipelotrichaceae bacterium]|nr:glycoside hydrolase family 3 C-terminal domain-containing protein [Erysipelotrichaceae bacterium]